MRSFLWNSEPTPDFAVLCHFTMLSYSCSHEQWLKTPRIVHTSFCTFEHVRKERHRCQNMARIPETLPVSSLCPTCLDQCTSRSYEDAGSAAVGRASGTTNTKAKINNIHEAETLGTRADMEELYPEVGKLDQEALAVKAVKVPDSPASTAPSKTSTKVMNCGFSGLVGQSSTLGMKRLPESLEGAPVGGGWMEVESRSSVGSWIEVENGPEWNLGDEDQGLLTQRQKDKRPQRRRWLMGLV